MKVRITHIFTRRSGNKARREETFDVESLTVGRGTDNNLQFGDLTIALHHLAFHEQSGQIHVEGVDGSPLRINGHSALGGNVSAGDVIRIGGYELRPQPSSGDGEDLYLEVEELERPQEGRAELAKRTRIGVDRGLLTRRKLSWALALGMPALLVATPLLTGWLEPFWNSGPISSKHATIANDCQKCHEVGFQAVRDTACAACHSEIGDHAPGDVQLASLSEATCASCHREHGGEQGLAEVDQDLCSDCHSNLSQRLSATDLEDAGDFGRHHPEFRISLPVAAQGAEPVRVRWSPEIREQSGLIFNHLRHVGQRVPDKATGEKRSMHCGECHVADASGKTMRLPVYEDHCQSCHSLDFDERAGDRQAMHGDPAVMRRDLQEFYAWLALSADKPTPRVDPAPSVPRTHRRRPGDRPAPPPARLGPLPSPKSQALGWAQVQKDVDGANRFLMENEDRCGLCHVLDPGGAGDGSTGVEPIHVATVWLPKSDFDHSTHETFACRECHAAAAAYDPDFAPDAARPAWAEDEAVPYGLYDPATLRAEHGLEPSEDSADVLVPSLATCRRCHGDAQASPPQVASSCVLCHPFHRKEHGTMRSLEASLEDGVTWVHPGASR